MQYKVVFILNYKVKDSSINFNKSFLYLIIHLN